MKKLISLGDISPDEVCRILEVAADLKAEFLQGRRPGLLQNRVVTMLFEKPSLRTRNSFEAAAKQLGGSSIFLSGKDAGLDGREALCDVARVLSSYSDAVVLRTFSQALIEEFASYSVCPVINGLSDDRHPCQALTDLFTIREEFGDLVGRRLVYIGDGNNIASSLALATAMLDLPMTVCSPPGYALPADFVSDLQQRFPAARLRQESDPVKAVRDADIVYTDVWASMGQETQADSRRRAFAGYQVNAALLAQAPEHCRFMHDLPAHRGEEVTGEVLDGPRSIAFRQAENRMHLAKGLLAWLLVNDDV